MSIGCVGSQFGRPCEQEPISVAQANNLFDDRLSEEPLFSISEQEWKEYMECEDYEWDQK